jgi:hypothetical protein
LASVISACDGMSNRFGAADSRIEAARVAGLLGQDDDRIRLLDEAEALCHFMGAGLMLDQITALRAGGEKAAATGG